MALAVLLMTACSKWLIEGILDQPLLEVVTLALGLFVIVMQKGFHIKKIAVPWILYMANIAFSLLIHDSSVGLWGRGLITVLMTAYALFIDSPISDYYKTMRFVIALGLFAAANIMIHYMMGRDFNQIYFPLLNITARDTANLYYRSGYYFGLMYNPHEPAGLIAYTIAAIWMWKMINKSKNKLIYLGLLLLLVPLLLTGKKGILVCMLVTLAISMLTLYGSRKQWMRGIGFVLVLILLMVMITITAINHPEIEIFNRLNKFINLIIGGGSFDSGRTDIYRMAIQEWESNYLFGIGWRHFNALTTAKYGMSYNHEVNCDYLQWMCETGIVGFVLSIIPVLIMAFRTAYVGRIIVRKSKSNTDQWDLMFAIYIQYFTVIYAFVEIPFFDIVYFSIYILSCIIINSAYVRRKQYYE